MAHSLLEGILQLVYPPHCIECGLIGSEVLCESCLSALIVPIPTPFCLRCGQVQTSTKCYKCTEYPEQFIRCRAVGLYQGRLADLIHQLKYRDKPMLAIPLSKLIADYLFVRSEIFNNMQFDAIVPVPLYSWRERQRGYNQSARLANGLSQSSGLPVERKVLKRIRNTKQQVGMLRSGRLRNIEGAFKANASLCEGKTFLLIDDVSTTGSTLKECAKELISAGAVRVFGVTLAAG